MSLQDAVEKIELNYQANVPLVNVEIAGKTYQFLFDTGAPTVISSKIYNDLNLKKKGHIRITDSQKNRKKQILSEIPEMKIGRIIFKNIGAVVIDLNQTEFNCLKIDGVIGANQMAKLFWRINYSEKSLEATKDISNFSTDGYETVFSFEPKMQKTPLIKATILDQQINLTFDTGFTGYLKIQDKFYDPKNTNHRFVEVYGNSSIGAFGTSKPQVYYQFKPNEIILDNHVFKNQILATGTSNLLGNEFLRKYRFIIDWKNNKIYLNKINSDELTLKSFGFGYRFIDNKAKVVSLFKEKDFPIQFDDEILSINDVNLENLDSDSVCNYIFNSVVEDKDSVVIKLKRAGKILSFSLEKKEYLK